MDKIWYRNPSKLVVIGRCGGDEKNEWPRRTNKKLNANFFIYFLKIQLYPTGYMYYITACIPVLGVFDTDSRFCVITLFK